MPDINDISTTGGLQKYALDLYKERMNPAEYQRQVQGRNSLIDEYEQGVRNAPPGLSQFQMGVSNWLGAGGTGPNDIVRGVGNAQSQFAKQQLSQHEARQQGLLDTAKMRDQIAKEEDLAMKSALSLASKMGSGKGVTVKMDRDGNMVVYDPATNESRVVHSSQRGEYQRIWTKAYEKAVQEDMENPEGYAANVASRVLSGSPGFNPLKQGVVAGEQPTEAKPPVFDPNAVGLQVPAGQGSPDINKLSPAEQQMAAALKAGTGMAQNPATAQAGAQMLQGLQSQFPRAEQGLIKPQVTPSLPPTQQAQPTPQAPRQGALPPATAPGAPETMQYVDQRTKAQQKGYGSEEGQELFKERKSLDTLYGANSKLLGQLNMLENIYKNPNIPEGELAGQISAFRSGMKSLGVDVSDKAGITDLAKAVSTGLALTQRTADGQNLLPGQMSNYEDQLLQKMAPTLNLTNQGRLALIGMMKQMAQSNIRIAEEGTKMAAGNKNMLTPDWYQRKERVMLEEQAKMKMMADQLIKQYGGK